MRDNDTIILPPYMSYLSINAEVMLINETSGQYIKLNKTASYIYNLIIDKKKIVISELLTLLNQKYNKTDNHKSIMNYLEELSKLKLIIING